MNKNELINTYLNKESIIDIFTSYEVYYQLGVGKIAGETIQSSKETIKKLEELNLQINPDQVISYIGDILLHHSHEKDFTDNFKYYIRTRALIQALDDFLTNDTELINSNYYRETSVEFIVEDTFLSQDQLKLFKKNYQDFKIHYELNITDEIVKTIQESIL